MQLRLFWNQTTGDQPIRASTSDGRVRLTGTVSSKNARATAARLTAMTAGGGRSLKNALEFAPDADTSASGDQARLALDHTDTGIAQRVRNSLHFDTRVPARDIDAEVRDGAAILTGQVETEGQREQASNIAGSLTGVTRVDNQLSVEKQSYILSPGGPTPLVLRWRRRCATS